MATYGGVDHNALQRQYVIETAGILGHRINLADDHCLACGEHAIAINAARTRCRARAEGAASEASAT